MRNLTVTYRRACMAFILAVVVFHSGCLCFGNNEETTTTSPTTKETQATTTTAVTPTTRPTTTAASTSPTTAPTTSASSAATTTAQSTTTTTSTTTTINTATTLCSGDMKGGIKLTEEDGNYGKLYLSFTGDDGRRYDNVGLFQGPYSKGDMFLLGGNVYQYDGASVKSHPNSCNTVEVYFKNMIKGNRDKLVLTAYTGDTIRLTTYPFEEAAENQEELAVEPDSSCNDTYVFLLRDVEGASGVSLLYDGGDIYFVSSSGDAVPDQKIGVWGRDAGGHAGQTGTIFGNFYPLGAKFRLQTYYEGDSDMNYDGDTDDALILLRNDKGEVAVIDLYDRNYDEPASSGAYYRMSVKVTDESNWNDNSGIANKNRIDATLNREDDTLVILPDSGYRINVDYGLKRKILDVKICPSI